MGRRGPKPIEFVCCALNNNKLISQSIIAASSEEAVSLFQKEFGCQPDNIHGPYIRKYSGVLNNTREIEFSDKRFKGIYKDWIVMATVLKYPENSAYLLFDKRVDGKKMAKPSGTYIIKLEEIKEIK